MAYRLEVAPAALPRLRTLDPLRRAGRRLQAAIELPAEHAATSGATTLLGGDGEWGVLAGDERGHDAARW